MSNRTNYCRAGARVSLLAIALTGAAQAGAQEGKADDRYPQWHDQWHRVGQLTWPPHGYEEAGPPPLTEEYQAIWDDIRRQQDMGLPVGDPTARCLPPGMPRVMKMDLPMEVIITPEVTYVYGNWDSQFRRIYTDGRDWPDYLHPTYNGYSIGSWHDEDGDGVYDMLSVETRGMKGPRSFDAEGVPLHDNNATVVQEEIRQIDEDTLENTITTTDDALTEPWTIRQRYQRETGDVVWEEHLCVKNDRYMRLGEYWYRFDPDEESLSPAPGQPELVPEQD